MHMVLVGQNVNQFFRDYRQADIQRGSANCAEGIHFPGQEAPRETRYMVTVAWEEYSLGSSLETDSSKQVFIFLKWLLRSRSRLSMLDL